MENSLLIDPNAEDDDGRDKIRKIRSSLDDDKNDDDEEEDDADEE